MIDKIDTYSLSPTCKTEFVIVWTPHLCVFIPEHPADGVREDVCFCITGVRVRACESIVLRERKAEGRVAPLSTMSSPASVCWWRRE